MSIKTSIEFLSIEFLSSKQWLLEPIKCDNLSEKEIIQCYGCEHALLSSPRTMMGTGMSDAWIGYLKSEDRWVYWHHDCYKEWIIEETEICYGCKQKVFVHEASKVTLGLDGPNTFWHKECYKEWFLIGFSKDAFAFCPNVDPCGRSSLKMPVSFPKQEQEDMCKFYDYGLNFSIKQYPGILKSIE